MEGREIENFNFERITQELAHLPESMVEAKTETTAHIFGIENKENQINNWLAFLLNPSRFGSAEPMNTFLELCLKKQDWSDEEYKIIDYEQVEVLREEVIGNGDRIDFLIHTAQFVIGIESKIHANLHPNQLENYSKNLKQHVDDEKELLRILLVPEENPAKPAPDSDFIRISYEELAEALNDLQYDYLNNLRGAFMLENFVNYVKEYLGGGSNSMNEEWAKFITSNFRELQTVFEEGVVNLKRFEDELIKCLNAVFEDESWEHQVGRNTHNQFWFQLNHPEGDKFNIHYEVGKIDDFHPHNFILPEKLKLTIDVESSKSRRFLQENPESPFKVIKKHNEIALIDINYSSKEEIEKSFKKIKEEFRGWHQNYGKRINEVLYSKDSE